MTRFKDRVVILLDYDGPLSNSRTWKMPHKCDPVAVALLNRFFDAGALAVLTSTIRKDKNCRTKADATHRLQGIGLRIKWLENEDSEAWRTSLDFTDRRHLEVERWLHRDSGLLGDGVGIGGRSVAEAHPDLHFIAFDDEKFPDKMCAHFNIIQPEIDCHNGIGYRGISMMDNFYKNHATVMEDFNDNPA